MSTYLQDLKKKDPEAYEKRVIVGASVGTVPFNNMIKALKVMSRLNTAEENKRLEAALWMRRNRKRY